MPSLKAYREYAKRKGIEVYRYDFGPKYIKSDKWDEEGRLFGIVLKRDYGNELPLSLPEEARKDILTLDGSMREDPDLIAVVEELGKEANSEFSKLVVVEVPNDVAEDYVIDEYDGIETLHKRVEEW